MLSKTRTNKWEMKGSQGNQTQIQRESSERESDQWKTKGGQSKAKVIGTPAMQHQCFLLKAVAQDPLPAAFLGARGTRLFAFGFADV